MEGKKITRRTFGKDCFATVVSVSLLESLFTGCTSEKNLAIPASNDVIKPKASDILNHWSVELNEICGDLKTTKISQLIWQKQIEKLYDRIELDELLGFVDFPRLSEKFEYPDLGVSTKKVVFPRIDGLPENTIFHKKMFGMKRGRAIIPHGHSNMASAHLVLKGGFELRHFEKIDDRKSHLTIKPTVEKSIKPADFSTISD